MPPFHSLLKTLSGAKKPQSRTQQSRHREISPPKHIHHIHRSNSSVLLFNTISDHRCILRKMLLPSALSCDVRRPSRFAAASRSRLLSTPPPSDDEVPVPVVPAPSGNGLMGTCRALQSLLNGSSPAPSPRRSKPARLQSPLHITRSTPSSSSARSRNLATPASPKQTTPAPPQSPAQSRRQRQRQQSPRTRGVNKRRRNSFESDFDYYSYDRNVDDGDDSSDRVTSRGTRFSTPKRRRHVPYDLPLGLSQSDFYSLHSPPVTASPSSPVVQQPQPQAETETETEPEAETGHNPDAALPSIEEEAEATAATTTTAWSEKDDQCLVEAVLEKFQLSQEDWDECAQRVGKDHASAGRRWQVLVGKGNVGLRSRQSPSPRTKSS